VAELPIQSHRILGDPPEYTPSQLEKIKDEKSKSSGFGTVEETETSTIIEYGVKGIEVNQLETSTILDLEVTETELDQTKKLKSHS